MRDSAQYSGSIHSSGEDRLVERIRQSSATLAGERDASPLGMARLSKDVRGVIQNHESKLGIIRESMDSDLMGDHPPSIHTFGRDMLGRVSVDQSYK